MCAYFGTQFIHMSRQSGWLSDPNICNRATRWLAPQINGCPINSNRMEIEQSNGPFCHGFECRKYGTDTAAAPKSLNCEVSEFNSHRFDRSMKNLYVFFFIFSPLVIWICAAEFMVNEFTVELRTEDNRLCVTHSALQ